MTKIISQCDNMCFEAESLKNDLTGHSTIPPDIPFITNQAIRHRAAHFGGSCRRPLYGGSCRNGERSSSRLHYVSRAGIAGPRRIDPAVRKMGKRAVETRGHSHGDRRGRHCRGTASALWSHWHSGHHVAEPRHYSCFALRRGAGHFRRGAATGARREKLALSSLRLPGAHRSRAGLADLETLSACKETSFPAPGGFPDHRIA